MLIFRCLGSRQLSLGRQHASRVHRIALRTFSINASNPALPKKLDLASRGNDYISIHVATDGKLEEIAASDLEVYPEFMSSHEQEVLLSAALKKLDSMASREERKKRREWNKANKATVSQSELRTFLPDEIYEFEQRHFDGVISGYRESTLSEWIPFDSAKHNETLASILQRAYTLILSDGDVASEDPLHTPSKLLSHLLHLSSTGYILPHVDNIEASAGSILGLCLGSERHLVLTSTEADREKDQIKVRLPPGCAYLQRGDIRYKWKHEIPVADPGDKAQAGQRLSVMIRDRLS